MNWFDLERLRQEARDELEAVIEHRCRQGDDPWDFIPNMPTVDEQVVLILCAERIYGEDLGVERAKAYHPSQDPTKADDFEYKLLRAVALDHPDLTPAVWSMIGKLAA